MHRDGAGGRQRVKNDLVLTFPMVDPAVAGILASSLALLAIGHLLGGPRGHLPQSVGWIFMAGFWGVETVAVELLEKGSPSNAIFTGMAALFALYLSYYAFLAWSLGRESRPLRFMALMAVVASIIYYPVEWSNQLAGPLVYFVAVQTAWALSALGYTVTVGGIHVGSTEEVFVPIEGTSVSIILACTAIQAVAIFGGAILATRADRRLKAKALLASILPIHILNIIRNVGIIVLVTDHGMPFDVAHSGIGKIFSLIVLIAILYYVFDLLPGLYDDIIGVLTLGEGLRRDSPRSGPAPIDGPASPDGTANDGRPDHDDRRPSGSSPRGTPERRYDR